MLVSGFWFLTSHPGSLGSSIKQLTTWQLDFREGEKEGGRGRAREMPKMAGSQQCIPPTCPLLLSSLFFSSRD